MFKIIKIKKILPFIAILFVIGIIFTGYFSYNVKAQTSGYYDESGLWQTGSPPANDTLSVEVAPGVTGNLQESVATDAAVAAAKDQENATCQWWKLFSDPLSTIISCTFNPLIGGVARLFTNLIQWALDMNAQLFTSPYINNGWTVARDIANLGFVLIMIIIAFGTILRMENYGFKKTLIKLIVAALLVNFSLMICAALVSLSDIITHYFITNGFHGHPGDNIASALGLTPKNNLSFTVDLVAGPVKAVVGLIFGLILLVIITITLAAIAVMLLIRYVVLGILVVLSPLAWLCSILPGTADLWKKWWSNFIHWVIFAPLMLFFVWLAMFAPTVSTSTSSDTGLIAGVGNLFIMTGLLLGGLMIANSLGITGAKQFNKWATAGAVGVGAFVGRKTAGGLLQTRLAQKTIGGLEKTGLNRSGALRAISEPFRRAGAGLSSTQDKIAGSLITKREKEFEDKHLGTEDLVLRAQKGSAEEKVAAFNILNKKNKLSKLTASELSTIQTTGARFGEDIGIKKAIEKQVPHLSEKVMGPLLKGNLDASQKALEELIKKIEPQDWSKIDISHMVKNLDTRQVGAQAIMNVANKDSRFLSSIEKSLKTDARDEVNNALRIEVSTNPTKYQSFVEKARKTKNLFSREVAGITTQEATGE